MTLLNFPVQDWSSIISVIVLVTALIIAYTQIKEATRQRITQTTMEVTKLIADENFVDKNGDLIRHKIC